MDSRLLPLDNHALSQLLDELDQRDCPVGSTDAGQPVEPQFPYRVRALQLHVDRGERTKAAFRVHPRSIGRRSLSVLASTNLRARTPCRILPIDTEGGWQEISGKILSARRLEQLAQVWDVRIGFDEPIDVVRFAPAAWRARTLVADDSRTIRQLLSQVLPALHCDVECAENGEQVLAAAAQQRFDLILMDVEMPVMSGIDAVRALRERGYVWPVVIMSGMPEKECRGTAMDAGCDAWLRKPMQTDDLKNMVQIFKPRPLISALVDDPAARPLVNTYVSELRGMVEDGQRAFRDQDREALVRLARRVVSESAPCGFPSLNKPATRVEEAVVNNFPLSDVRRPLCELLRKCLAARPASGFDAEANPVTPPAVPAPEPASA